MGGGIDFALGHSNLILMNTRSLAVEGRPVWQPNGQWTQRDCRRGLIWSSGWGSGIPGGGNVGVRTHRMLEPRYPNYHGSYGYRSGDHVRTMNRSFSAPVVSHPSARPATKSHCWPGYVHKNRGAVGQIVNLCVEETGSLYFLEEAAARHLLSGGKTRELAEDRIHGDFRSERLMRWEGRLHRRF